MLFPCLLASMVSADDFGELPFCVTSDISLAVFGDASWCLPLHHSVMVMSRCRSVGDYQTRCLLSFLGVWWCLLNLETSQLLFLSYLLLPFLSSSPCLLACFIVWSRLCHFSTLFLVAVSFGVDNLNWTELRYTNYFYIYFTFKNIYVFVCLRCQKSS